MSLNVIGLISGGKDSLYSLAHCVQNGHKIVALANLCPAETRPTLNQREDDDINSFMYQTVGYSVIPLFAQALDLPLYRRAISGAALQNSKDYEVRVGGGTQADETEDMYYLIKDILSKHPNANALSAGAILSTYQRTRVESVATRLGLVPLAYLWQYPALPPPSSRKDSLTGLLDDMNTAGCDARIIKLASGGIRSNMVFSNVASRTCTSQLLKGLHRFYNEPGQEFELRGAVLGEGGEYETLALDGPSNLWKQRITTDLTESFELDGVTYAHFTQPRTIVKDGILQNDMPIPCAFDERFNSILKMLDQTLVASEGTPDLYELEHLSMAARMELHGARVGDVLQVCNLTAPGKTATEQFVKILDNLFSSSFQEQLRDTFSTQDEMINDIVSVTLLLDEIRVFAEVNRVYSERLWPSNRAIPPARVTIATYLPPSVHVSLSIALDMTSNKSRRDGLHVQSRSYWAPANIGPYSQAVSSQLLLVTNRIHVNGPLANIEVVHMAGQIPLFPSSMQLSEETFGEQATMALQHLWRVGQERKVDLWLGAGVAYLSTLPPPTETSVDLTDTTILARAREAAAIWELAHLFDEKGKNRVAFDDCNKDEADSGDEQEDIDVWHKHQNRGLESQITTGEHLHTLPNYAMFSNLNTTEANQNGRGLCDDNIDPRFVPVFVAAEVAELPRYASIEWWSTGIAGLLQATSQRHLRVHAFHKTLSEDCLAAGTILRYYKTRNSNQDEQPGETIDGNEFSGTRKTCTIFCTLIVDLSADQAQVANLVKNPSEALLEIGLSEIPSGACRVRASHSFVSLSAPPALQEAIAASEVVKSSTIVPCKRVWTSKYHEDARQPYTSPAIRQAALAMILRLDID